MRRNVVMMSCATAALVASGVCAGTFNSDFSNPAQPGVTLTVGQRANGDPSPAIAGGVLALTYAEGSLSGSAFLADLDGGQPIAGFDMTFRVRIGGGTSDPADGMSVYFGPEDLASLGTAFGEEGPEGGTGLVISFDTFNNGDNEAPAIDVKYGGNLIARVPYTAGNLQSDTFSQVRITVKSNGTLDMTYKGQTVFSNLFLPGYTHAAGRFAFGARTGGAWSNHWIDDLSITTTPAGAATLPTVLTPPVSQTVNEHARVVFSALPGGTPPFTIQWLRNDAPIDGATSLSYVIPSASAALNGSVYKIRFTTPQGEVTSDGATLTVNADTAAPTIASVRGSESFTEATVVFSEAVSAATAGALGNYSIAGLAINSVTVVNPTTVRLATARQTVGARYTLTVNNVADVANTPNVIAAGSTREFGAWVLARGFLKFEAFLNIGGTPVQNLLDDPKFQANTPDVVGYVSSFNSRSFYPTDATENYGARISGFFTPTQSGDYRFFSRSDDASQTFLSGNADPAGAVQIAEETACCNNFLEPGAAQTSEPVTLTANTPYFIQMLYKEGGGGDFGQVAFRREGDLTAAANLTPILGRFLSTYADPDAASAIVSTNPVSVTGSENTTVTFTAAGTGAPAPVVLQWQRAESGGSTFVDIDGAIGTSYTTPVLKQSTDNGAQYRVEVRVPGKTVASTAATLTVIIDSTPPSIVRAVAEDNLKGVTLTFSEAMLAAGLATPANYTIPGVTVSGVTVVNPATVRLVTTEMAQGASLTVTAAGIRDSAGNVIVAPGNTAAFKSPLIVAGAMLFEAYTGFGGVVPADLKNNAKYPNSPDVVRLVPGYEVNGFGDNYGARIRGFFTPPATGDYVAYFAADDGGELYLSTDDSPSNKRLVAVEPVWAGSREWTGESGGRRTEAAKLDPNQVTANVSLPIRLEAGRRYYTEILYKEGGGGDHGAAKFALASETVENGSTPTFGAQLSTAVSPDLLASISLATNVRSAAGSGGQPGFRARIHQISPVGTTGLPNFIYRAEQQLAGIIDPNVANLTGAVDGVFQISGIINWNQDFATAEIGNFTSTSTPAFADEAIPGIPGTGREAVNTDNIAGEVITYVEFPTPGIYTMGVNSDDGFAVTATDVAPVNNLGLNTVSAAGAKGYYAVSGGSDKGSVFRPITAPISGKLVLADPLLADTPLKNADAVRGNIAVIDRGVVAFSLKVQHALSAGAIGVVMVNNRDPDSAEGKYPIVMGGSFVDLPTVMIGRPDGTALKTAMAAGEVTATIGPDTTPYLGSFDGGRGASDSIFAFNVLEAGVYPMRLVWFEGGGGANLEWFSVSRDGSKIPLNDRSNPAALRTFRTRTFAPPVTPEVAASADGTDIVITFKGALQSSETIGGTFTDVPGATSPHRIPAGSSAGNRFYRARQ